MNRSFVTLLAAPSRLALAESARIQIKAPPPSRQATFNHTHAIQPVVCRRVETQRQWSHLAIERTTPVLLGLFSMATLLAERLHRSGKLIPRQAAWHLKPALTFSDAIAAVRRRLWASEMISGSLPLSDRENATIPAALLERWAQALAYAA